ncbi:Glycosyl Hydrolase Family 88 [Bacteroides ovatus]|uniref:Glycosyl Hydrolase Family 88 n=1 Tax=Bacteroides ovatus TaxID=28116 RepID=A0A1G6G395_BACOV|nr:glycoside hydrolase family 88 protein [Bacteroides ovatus]SDB76477.1 Glycosyl Hydrolase Family 88 [Bacteroides ovatus]
MKYYLIILLFFLIAGSCQKRQEEPMEQLIDRVMSVAAEQYKEMAQLLPEGQFPRSITADGKLKTSDKYWWCSGFYPGTLWYLYEYSGNEDIHHLAERYTEMLDTIKYVTSDHDVGFQLFCSYGNGYRINRCAEYKDVLVQGAKSLATRFHPVIGCIQSWDFDDPGWRFPVIIDNMLNLELLIWVAEQTDNDSLYHIACSHADVTMKNHFRKNFSCYHLVDYAPADGSVRKKQTVQGAGDESSWARGQAWALYGYSMMYRYTKDDNYLNQAKNVADFIMNHPAMPQDGVPYWDFDSSDIPNDYRDASAAAIMASGFIDLSIYVPEKEKTRYINFAQRQLRTLSSEEYLAKDGTNRCFLLKHSVGSLPGKSEVDVPQTYADYYYIEALLKYKKEVLGK